jgi:hypothetical protein
MSLSENSVPLHPMVLLIIIPIFYGYFIGGIAHFQTYPYVIRYDHPIWICLKMGYTPNEIAIKNRDNDQQNQWV